VFDIPDVHIIAEEQSTITSKRLVVSLTQQKLLICSKGLMSWNDLYMKMNTNQTALELFFVSLVFFVPA
jgi:hypothetical protein